MTRLLLVDDEAPFVRALGVSLRAMGYEVDAAATGAAALAKAATTVPDIIVLDLGLPDIDGLEVARRLRDLADLSGTRLIALTGYGQAEDVRQAIEAGFDAHVTKPINFDQLMALLAGRDEPLTGARGGG